MNEEPKSIWKKSWQFPKLLWLWLGLMAATMLIFLIIALIINMPFPLAWVFISGAVGATVFLMFWIFVRWIFRWRNFKRFLFGCACFATLIALFYAEENWRGKHDWEKFKREWAARGEKFDWQSVVPPPVPDDQNFAMSPVWIAEERYIFQNTPKRAEAWYGDRIYSEAVSNIFNQLPVSVSGLVGTNWWVKRGLPNTPDSSGNWATAHMMDLQPWQSYYRGLEATNLAAEIPVTPQPQTPAQDVLLALSKFDPVIDQLRADGARPYSRFPVGYADEDKAAILLPHLSALKVYAQVLQLRAIAELQNDQSEPALADVKLMLRLVAAIRTEPFLITHLVRIAMLEITLQPIYQGLAEHKWSEAQLMELDSELARLDFLTDYKLAMHGEMGFQDGDVHYLLKHPEQYRNFMTGDINTSAADSVVAVAMKFHLVPIGWFYQNQLRCARMMMEYYIPVADTNQGTFSPDLIRRGNDALFAETKTTSVFNLLERLMLPALDKSAKKFAYAQSSVDLARTAIALERYRLSHGQYPESLDTLAPQFIGQVPHDVIGGGSLKYRRTDDGQFILYSVGWNETDDDGVISFNHDKSQSLDTAHGDWVWRYPAIVNSKLHHPSTGETSSSNPKPASH